MLKWKHKNIQVYLSCVDNWASGMCIMSQALTALTRQENASTFSLITVGALIVFTDLIWRIINALVPQFVLIAFLGWFFISFAFLVSDSSDNPEKKNPTFRPALKGWLRKLAARQHLSALWIKNGQTFSKALWSGDCVNTTAKGGLVLTPRQRDTEQLPLSRCQRNWCVQIPGL